jgi:hypothetical protein
MLINGRENQPRVNLTKNSVFTLTEHSTSFQECQLADTLTSSTIETWSSRQEMEEELNSGGSIKNH